MNSQDLRETYKVSLCKIGSFTRNKSIHISLRYAEFASSFVGYAFLQFKFAVRLTPDVNINYRIVKTVTPTNMLKFMSKNENEIINAIKAKRHAYNGRCVV